MISSKLQSTFFALETIAFQEWKKAPPKKREQITRKLAKLEATMILKEIEEEVNKKIP